MARRGLDRPWRGHAAVAVDLAVALSGGSRVARIHLPPRAVERTPRRRVDLRRRQARPLQPAGQPVAERRPLRRSVGILELLGGREMALHGADYGEPENLRDAGPRLSGFP